MTSRQTDQEVPRDSDNSSPPRQQSRRHNVENDPPVEIQPMEDFQLRHVPITDAEINSLSQLENLNNPSLTLNVEQPLPPPREVNVSFTITKDTTSDSLPENQTIAPLILPLASSPIPDRDFSELPIPQVPKISPIIITGLNRPMPSSSSGLKPNKRDTAQTGQGDQSRPRNILQIIKERTPTETIFKPTPVTKASKSVPKPTETIAASHITKSTPSTTASKSIPSPNKQTLVATSFFKSTKTTRAARTVLEPATVTIVARPTPESTLTSGISRTTSTVQSKSGTSTTKKCYFPNIDKSKSGTSTTKPCYFPDIDSAKNISTSSTNIRPKKCYFPDVIRPKKCYFPNVTCATKIPRKATETCTTVTTCYFPSTTTRTDTESSQTIKIKKHIPNILRKSRVPRTTSVFSSLDHTRTTCMTTSTLNTGSLLSTGIRMQNITERPTMQPRIFSLVAPSVRHGAKTYVVDSITKPLPTSSESCPIRLVLRPKNIVSSTGIIDSPPAGSITYESTPIAETVEPSRTMESILSLDATNTETLLPNQSVSSTQAPILTSPCFPIRQDPVLRYENRSHVVTTHPQDMPRFVRRTEPDLLHEHLTTCDSPPSRSEPRRILTKTTRIHVTETRGTPVTIASRSSVTEVPLSTQSSAAGTDIRKIIKIRNPNTNRIQEYWIRRNTEMLAQVGGSVNDSISPRLPVNSTAASRAPVHDVVASRAPMSDVATSCAPINVASTSGAAPRVIVLTQNILLNPTRKKKNLKGIKRAQANPVNVQSSSSGDPSRSLTKQMSTVHRRPKQCRNIDNAESSGYPIWKDENMSQESSEIDHEGAEEATRNNIGLLTMSAMEKVQSFLVDVDKFIAKQFDDESDTESDMESDTESDMDSDMDY